MTEPMFPPAAEVPPIESPNLAYTTWRRWFSPAETTAGWLRQDRRCADCRREIPRDLIEGDHIVPWSQGGPTTLDNLQALCVACNRRKGNQPGAVVQRPAPQVRTSAGPMRQWQDQALEVVAATADPVLIEACPGAGKTRFALEAAARMIQAGEINRVLIVVPTARLVGQWVEAAQGDEGGASLPLAPSTWRPTQPLYAPWCGAAFTYHALFAQTTMFQALASEPGYRTLVIFDEVHHAGAESGWGIAAQQAFGSAAARVISLSGTPFRTKDPIAFVRTENGRSVSDYSYDYGQAVTSGACRPVQFMVMGGTARFLAPDGAEHTVTFDNDLNDRGESFRLRTALEVGTHVEEMIHVADGYLRRLRAAGDTDAAGLVVCMDCDHAERVAGIITRLTRMRPMVVASRTADPDDPAPARGVAAFTKGTAPWIVSVRMVSEGIDIRRLRTVVYATNVVAELFFRQIVGRIVRTDPANGDNDHGMMVLPADPRLTAMAERLTQEAPQVLSSPLVVTDRRNDARHVDPITIEPGADRGTFTPLDSSGEIDHVTDTHGRRADRRLVEAAERYVQATGSPMPPFELALAAAENPKIHEHLMRY